MCGLVGIAGDITTQRKSMFKDLLVMDSLRGPHSTGVMAADVNGNVDIFKRAVLPYDLFDMRGYDKAVSWTPHVLMGHNRYATIGAVNSVNAHPFHWGDVVGAHNGTLVNQRLLPDWDQFEVDSENLVYSIHKMGLEATIKDTHGAFALSLYDQGTKEITLVRNDERPLFYAYSEDKDLLIWASEQWMIRAAAQRAGIKLERGVHDVVPLQAYTFVMPPTRMEELPDPVITKVQEYTPPKQKTPLVIYNGRGSTSGEHSTEGGVKIGDVIRYYAVSMESMSASSSSKYLAGMTTASPHTHVRTYCPTEKAEELLKWKGEIEAEVVSITRGDQNLDEHIVIRLSSVKCVPDRPPLGDVLCVEGPKGEHITEEDFNERTKHGCCVCQGDLIYGRSAVHWDFDAAFCEDCYLGFYDETPLGSLDYYGGGDA